MIDVNVFTGASTVSWSMLFSDSISDVLFS